MAMSYKIHHQLSFFLGKNWSRHLPTTHTRITRRHTIIHCRRRCHHPMMILVLIQQPHCVAIVMHYHWIILWCWIYCKENYVCKKWGKDVFLRENGTYSQTSLDYYYWPQMKLTVALIVVLSVHFLALKIYKMRLVLISYLQRWALSNRFVLVVKISLLPFPTPCFETQKCQ